MASAVIGARWLVSFGRSRDPVFRLACLPHAGGSAGSFSWLRSVVEPDGELLCVQYPGRQERRHERAIDQWDDMVRTITGLLAALPGDDVPLVLFGHSLGALLAFEVARRREAAGDAVLGLIVSGRRAPGVRPPGPSRELTTTEILAEMKVLGGREAPVPSEPDVLDLILPVVRADYRLAESYRHGPDRTVSCPLTVLTGQSDARVSLSDAQAWRACTTASFDLRTFSGGHFFFERDRRPVASGVAAVLDGLRSRRVR